MTIELLLKNAIANARSWHLYRAPSGQLHIIPEFMERTEPTLYTAADFSSLDSRFGPVLTAWEQAGETVVSSVRILLLMGYWSEESLLVRGDAITLPQANIGLAPYSSEQHIGLGHVNDLQCVGGGLLLRRPSWCELRKTACGIIYPIDERTDDLLIGRAYMDEYYPAWESRCAVVTGLSLTGPTLLTTVFNPPRQAPGVYIDLPVMSDDAG